MRYKLRSSKKACPGRDEPRSSVSDYHTVSESEGGSGSPPAKLRKTLHRRKTLTKVSDTGRQFRDTGQPSLTIFSLPQGERTFGRKSRIIVNFSVLL